MAIEIHGHCSKHGMMRESLLKRFLHVGDAASVADECVSVVAALRWAKGAQACAAVIT